MIFSCIAKGEGRVDIDTKNIFESILQGASSRIDNLD
jgi:hypothetical protein